MLCGNPYSAAPREKDIDNTFLDLDTVLVGTPLIVAVVVVVVHTCNGRKEGVKSELVVTAGDLLQNRYLPVFYYYYYLLYYRSLDTHLAIQAVNVGGGSAPNGETVFFSLGSKEGKKEARI